MSGRKINFDQFIPPFLRVNLFLLERQSADVVEKAPTTWFVSPFDAYVQFEGQSDQSYMEQKLAIKIGIRSIDKYLQQLGPRAATQTKNLLIQGVPGSGKSYVAQYLNLYAISKGLRLVPTSIMGV